MTQQAISEIRPLAIDFLSYTMANPIGVLGLGAVSAGVGIWASGVNDIRETKAYAALADFGAVVCLYRLGKDS